MLIPEPKQITIFELETIQFSSIYIAPTDIIDDAKDILKRKLWDVEGLSIGDELRITVEEFFEFPAEAPKDLFLKQGYALVVSKNGVLLQCDTKQGFVNGISTLKQLMKKNENGYQIQCCKIVDWPLVEKRSISNCLTWYSGYGRIGFDMQLFGYNEWLEFLNVCSDLKINQFNLCIYGFWPFEMPKYPESEFRNVQIKAYNPESDSFITTTFTHPNLVEEFLSRLIEDAHALCIEIYAYMGLNSYSGGYPCLNKEQRMVLPSNSPYINDFDRMCFSKPENIEYYKECVKSVVNLGFDGIDFEESEEGAWFCGCDECKKNFLSGGKSPSEAMYKASFSLFNEIYEIVRSINPNCAIGIRAFRQQPLIKSEQEMKLIKDAVPNDVVFFWAPGLYVPDSEYTKWIQAFGKQRIVGRDTESNGISACFGRLIRTFRSNGLRCETEPLQQYIEEDVRQHMQSAKLSVMGTNGFMFEWYGFFLHLMVHANYPWGGTSEPQEFFEQCCEHLYGNDGKDVLFAIQNMLTIHESQLNIFPQFLPFAAHKVEEQDIETIKQAEKTTLEIVEKLSSIYEKISGSCALKSEIAHIRKLVCANKRNLIIYKMALVDLELLQTEDRQKRRELLIQLRQLNDQNFDIVKNNFYDIAPMETTGIKSCMIPYHELKRVIDNELYPDQKDEEMIYLGVEAIGWMY